MGVERSTPFPNRWEPIADIPFSKQAKRLWPYWTAGLGMPRCHQRNFTVFYKERLPRKKNTIFSTLLLLVSSRLFGEYDLMLFSGNHWYGGCFRIRSLGIAHVEVWGHNKGFSDISESDIFHRFRSFIHHVVAKWIRDRLIITLMVGFNFTFQFLQRLFSTLWNCIEVPNATGNSNWWSAGWPIRRTCSCRQSEIRIFHCGEWFAFRSFGCLTDMISVAVLALNEGSKVYSSTYVLITTSNVGKCSL